MSRILVTGWFSFEKTGATAGDLLAKDLVCEWIEHAGCEYDVALASPFEGGVDWQTADPARYSHVVFVCGPFYRSNLLQRFERCQLVGVNLSMTEPVESWNPFDLLLERDSSTASRPDITFLARGSRVPIVGLILGDEIGNPDAIRDYGRANTAIRDFVSSRTMATVAIDTRFDIPNRSGLRTPAEIESLVARMDVVLTTRLHGMVFAIKNGVPAIAVDPVSDGGKIRRQADALGWPLVFAVDSVKVDQLHRAFDYCLTQEARLKTVECRQHGIKEVEELRDVFVDAIRHAPAGGESWGDGRKRGAWVMVEPPSPATSNGPRRLLARLRQTLSANRSVASGAAAKRQDTL